MTWDPDETSRITASFLGADDYVDYERDQAWEDGNDNYGVTENFSFTAGMGWKELWPKNGFSETVLSWNRIVYHGDYSHTLSGDVQALQNSTESKVSLHNGNTWLAGNRFAFRFGLDAVYSNDEYSNFYAADTNYSGGAMPELTVSGKRNDFSGALFGQCSWSATERLTLNLGARVENSGTAPRGSVSYSLTPVTSLSAASGIYRQSLSGELLARNKSFESLDTPESAHFVLGLKHLISPETRVQVEVYLKQGNGFPFDPEQPGYFILDGVNGEQDLYAFQDLQSGGETRAAGVELTLQKQLVNGFYGLAAGSIYSSEYRNPGEPWRRRIYDSRWTGTLEGGYRFDSGWEVSCRWLSAGGRPYTPLDLVASQEMNRTVLDSTRINGETYPFYSSLNLRVDRRFNFSGSSLICYLSVWNALNRRNVTATYWNRIENKEDYLYQWATMPVIGIEYEF